MTISDLPQLLRNEWSLSASLVLSALVLLWLARRVRRIARSERPDDALSTLAMLIGLGWSSEAVWVLTDRAHFATSLRLLLFFVLETLLVLSMIRAKRAMRELGHPGRSGRTAWIVATGMALVAVGVAESFAEAVLRLLIPLLITNAWWDGLVGEGVRKRLGATSWRWTPRRLLLWLGAIEPGERDVETVHRERLTQQMTRLEFNRRHGSERQKERSARRLARLGLTADDAVIGEVRARVDRAMWFEVKQEEVSSVASPAGVPAREAASRKARRVLHRRSLRTLRVACPAPVASAVQEPEPDPRTKQEIDDAVRFMKAGNPGLTQRQIAALVRTSDTRVHRVLRSSGSAKAKQQTEINGKVPDLEGVK